MKEPVWVLRDLVVAAQQMLLADHSGLSGIRDEDLLDSALSRPKNLFAYTKPVSIFDLAASYSYGLALNHPFVNGNKRISLTIAAIFLEINGYALNASEPEAVITFKHLAAGQITEQQLSFWFEKSSIPNT